MSNQVPAPIFRGTGPGLVPRVTSQSGRLLRDNGTFATQALNYLGEVAGASIVGAETVDPGDFYYITTTGGGFTAGNWAISNGTAWTEVTSIGGNVPVASQAEVNAGTEAAKYVAPATLHGYVNPLLAAKTPVDYIQMDGATANRAAGIYGPFDAATNRRGWIAGVPTLQLAIDLPRLTVAPTTRSHIAGFYSGVSGSVDAGETSSLYAYINATTGSLALRINSTVDASNRAITLDSFVTTFMTERRKLLITFSGSGTPVVSLDGVDITGLFGAETTGGASPPADWSLSNLSPAFFLSGKGWPAAQAPLVIPILGALSDAESALWFSTGQLPAWVVQGGHAAQYLSDFAAGASGFTGANTVVAGDIDGINGEDDVLRFYATAASAVHFAGVPITFARAGKYRITGRIYVPTGLAAVTNVVLFLGGDGPVSASWTVVSGTRTFTPDAAWQDIDLIINVVAGYSVLNFYFNSGGAFVGANSTTDDVAYLKSIKVQAYGATTIPVVQPCLVVGDGTLIGDNCGRILGGIPVTPRDRYRIVARTHTTSAENVQLLGGNIFLDANRSRIDSIASVQNSGGNLDLEIGSASGSANIAASTSIINGSVPTEVAPALRYVPTQALWARRVAGAGTAPFTITVEGHRVAANP